MTVVALAGRRIDVEGATPARFPLEQAESVKSELRALFHDLQPSMLICSAACGADLLALEAAAELRIPATIVLPFDQTRFRETSVIDRPGDWGTRFDTVLRQVKASGSIMVVQPSSANDDETYALVGDELLSLAQKLAASSTKVDESNSEQKQVAAVVVWDGTSRGPTDLTDRFRRDALARNFVIYEVSTLPPN
jgi:hypothetical protein